jgi:hypothetical protein
MTENEQGPQPDADPAPSPEPRAQRSRFVPRSAWWVLAIAGVLVLAFALVRPTWFTHSRDTDPLDVPADRHFAKTIAGPGHGDGVWLTNDAPSITLTVALPVDSSRHDTQLRLNGTSQVAEDSTVFLMVYLDGQQISETELPRREHPLNLTIRVPDQAAQDGKVKVHIRTRGTLSHETCTQDSSPGMVIHLDGTSVVESALDEPLRTVRDVVAGLDRDVTVVLADKGHDWLNTAAIIGMALTRSNYVVSYADKIPDAKPDFASSNWIVIGPEHTVAAQTGWKRGGDSALDGAIALGTVDNSPTLAVVKPQPVPVARFLATPALASGDTAVNDPQAIATALPAGNEMGLGVLGVDLAQTQISDDRGWAVPYSLADLPGGRLPQAARVVLRLPGSPKDLTWILNVSLNGTLVDSLRLARSSDPVVIPLPPNAQLVRNQMSISVQRDRDIGGCGVRTTTYPIQLQAESALILGDDPGAGLTALPRRFSGGYTVHLADGGDPIALLTTMVPVLAEFTGWDKYPDLRWDTQISPGEPFVVIGQSAGVTTPVNVRDGRLIAGARDSLNLTAFQNGTVVQCASGPNANPGLAMLPVGTPSYQQVPAFGRECAQVLTPGGNFALADTGEVLVAAPSRPGAPR